jgi:glycosyltransferase involved in cell wall biosynthesis
MGSQLFVYSLTASNLYGTERVAINTLELFKEDGRVVVVLPPGPANRFAIDKGFETRVYRSLAHKCLIFFLLTYRYRKVNFMTISTIDSVLYTLVRTLQLRSPRHVHVIHGSGYPDRSYRNKKILNWMGVSIVAVSDYVKTRLQEYGVNISKVTVIENFLLSDISECPRRQPYIVGETPTRCVVISRLEPPKRVDLLIDAIERSEYVKDNFVFDVFGDGPELQALRERCTKLRFLGNKICFRGFQPTAPSRICEYDILVHLCPIEPFGVVFLEAMASGVIVIAPNRGSGVIVHERTGMLFEADDADSLAEIFAKVRTMSAEQLNGLVSEAKGTLGTRFSRHRASVQYHNLFR